MNNEEINKFCIELNQYLTERYSYRSNHARVCGFGQLINTGALKKFELYLRYKPQYHSWPQNTLVVARLFFGKTRSGNGKDFLLFLIENSQKFNIDYIGLESTNKKASSFAKKYGFTPLKNEKNCWYGSISQVEETISLYK